MGMLYDVMLDFLREDGWPVHEVGDGLSISTAFEGENGSWTCVAQAVEDVDICVFYSISPWEAPPEHRADLAEMLAYENYGNLLGGFEVSPEDGDVRFKTSLSVLGVEPQVLADGVLFQMLKNMIYINVLSMDQQLPAIQAVISGQQPPRSLAS